MKKLTIKMCYEFNVPNDWELLNLDGEDPNEANEIKTKKFGKFAVELDAWQFKPTENCCTAELADIDVMDFVKKGYTSIKMKGKEIKLVTG